MAVDLRKLSSDRRQNSITPYPNTSRHPLLSSWNWSTGSKGPSGSTIGVAFTGLINTADAIAGYTPGASWCCPELDVEQPMLSLGGGNAAGQFTVDALSAIQKDLDLVTAANYTGIVFDVEEAIGSS